VAHGGNVAELLGDGMVVLFGAPIHHDDDPERAVRCALAMLRALREFNEVEARGLEMGIGVDTGVVIAGNIGSTQHMKYGVVGDAINLASRLESFTVGDQVLVSAATAARLGDIDLGPPLEFLSKGRREPIRCFVVRRLGELRAPEVEEPVTAVSLVARVWRLVGKSVEMSTTEVRVVGLGEHTVVVEGLSLALRDKVKLDLELPSGWLLDLYGTVEAVDPLRIHLSGLSTDALRALRAAQPSA
jgi:adenylate cyclase